MLTEVAIPKLTITMEGGTLLRWLKQEGASVAKDEVLFELETDKAIAEVPSPTDGILKTILVQEGEVGVGTVVGFVGDSSDPVPDNATRSRMFASEDVNISVGSTQFSSDQGATAAHMLRATPAARRRAKELAVDIALVPATGPEGRITQEDVEKAATTVADKEKSPNSAGVHRPIIAERVSRAWHIIPHIHIGGELKAVGLRRALEKARKEIATDITFTDLLLYSIASVLSKYPSLNTVWQADEPIPWGLVHVAFAVQTERGVVAPVLHDIEDLTLSEISSERKRLREAAQCRHLRPSDLEGATFTLTNLGMFPVDFFIPIISYPQSAILATGRVRDRLDICDGVPQSVPSMWTNVAVDHRVTDGATAAQFLSELEKLFDTLDQRIPQRGDRG